MISYISVLCNINIKGATNANHICNVTFPGSHIKTLKETGEFNFNSIFYLTQHTQIQ